MRNPHKSTFFFSVAAIFIFLDQLTKFLVKGGNLFGFNVEGMKIGQSFELIGSFVQITYIENEGMAFGISFGAAKILLSLFSVVASIFLAVYLSRLQGKHFFVRVGLSFILAGAVGNLIDRIFYGVFYGESPLFYGRVVDFVQVDIPDISIMGVHYTHWPIFNIADMCVTVGVIILLIFHNHIPLLNDAFNRKVKPVQNEKTTEFAAPLSDEQ